MLQPHPNGDAALSIRLVFYGFDTRPATPNSLQPRDPLDCITIEPAPNGEPL